MWLLRGRCCNLLALVSEQIAHLEGDTVRPAEANDVRLVTCGDFYVGGAADDVVLLADCAVVLKVLEDRLREMRRYTGRVAGEAVFGETLCCKPVCWSPAEGKIPLGAGGVITHGETAIMFEE